MHNNRILNIIIYLLSGLRTNNILIDKEINGDEITLNNCNYLLNQIIRQYGINNSHVFISEKAFELWHKIRDDDMKKYSYRDKIVKNNEEYVIIDKYKGGEKNPYISALEIKRGNTFTYNDVFTDEHIVTVSNIINELNRLSILDYNSVKMVLDNRLYICKMLKSEDRALLNRINRSLDYREVVVNDYYDVGIKLVGFDYQNTYETLINKYKNELIHIK